MQEDVAAPADIDRRNTWNPAGCIAARKFFWVSLEQEMLTNDEIDDRLKQLAIAAKNHPSRTWGRQQAMTKLITEIEKIKSLTVPKILISPPKLSGIFVQKPNTI